ncbi:MAG: sulfotransferase domain-containing protein [Elsteraceae bacterium]
MTWIHWLASYPKSGNTWLRILLQSYLAGGTAVDINKLTVGNWRSGERARFDEDIGVASSDLTGGEIQAWRAAAIQAWVRTLTQPVYLKIHDTRSTIAESDDLAPGMTRSAIYLVRDPRDVALSLARHMTVSVDQAITFMGTLDQLMEQSRRRLHARLIEHWGSWSQNVESWLAPAPFPVHVLRYEALRSDPEAALLGVLTALALPLEPEKIRAAVAVAALDKLRDQERTSGFIEGLGAGAFFGEGRVQGWRGRLTARQIAQIEADHGPVMRCLGYLDVDY